MAAVVISNISHINIFEVDLRPVGWGGGLEGVSFGLKIFIYTALTVNFNCPTRLESGPVVASLLLRITAVQASLVATMRVCS